MKVRVYVSGGAQAELEVTKEEFEDTKRSIFCANLGNKYPQLEIIDPTGNIYLLDVTAIIELDDNGFPRG